MRWWRRALGLAGVLMLSYGVLRLVSENSVRDLLFIALWMAAAVAIHDGLVSPAVLGVGRILTSVPARGRRYLQLALVVGAMVTVVAVPLIYRQGSQPPSKTLLVNDYTDRLAVLLGVVAAAVLLLYAVHVARSRTAERSPGAATGGGTDRS